MICQHCGSVIPDGSRFCTECGKPVSKPEIAPASVPEPETNFIPTGIPEPETEFVPTGIPEPGTEFVPTGVPGSGAEFIPTSIPEPEPAPEETPEEILPDIPEAEQPSFEAPAPEPAADWSVPTSEPAADWSVPAPEPAADWSVSAPAPAADWSVPTLAPAASSPASAAAPAGNAFGYTEIGVGASAPRPASPRPAAPAPDEEKKPVTKQWWFWAAVAALVILVIVLIASGGKDKGKDRPAANVGEPSSAAVSVRGSINAHKAAAPVGPMTYDEFVAYVEEYVNDRYASQGYQYFVEREDDEGDLWVEAYLWRDDTFSTASDAYDGNAAALAAWIDLTNDVAEADAELYRVMEEAGLSGTVILNLVDQEDYDYLLAFMDEGEIVYDQVTGIDLWGFDEYEAEE